MKIRYSFRSEKFKLPPPETIMETVREMHSEFCQNPVSLYEKYKRWIRPMNQLYQGHFISINEDTGDMEYCEFFNGESDIRLELYYIAPQFARIEFEVKSTFPYRIDIKVSSNNYKIKT